jgi:dTMP kinase
MVAGKFITFEGGEGSGKSTQSRLLADRLRTQGVHVVVTREPGGSVLADKLRDLILTPSVDPHSALAEALIFYAARADHLEKTIRPALASGHWVVCDRFSDSTRAYQGAAGGLASDVIDTLERMVVGNTQPDLTLLLDLDPKVGLARADARRRGTHAGHTTTDGFLAADTFEGRHVDFHMRLRAGFLGLAKANPKRVAVFDAFQNAEALADQIAAAVAARLGAA